MKSLLSTKSLKKIKLSLPVNGIEIIGNRLNLSQSTVSRVLSGKNFKSQKEVVECALAVVREEKQKIASLESEIESI